MRLRISHSTTYRYEPAATGVIQILRMTPGSHDGQYVAEWQIDVSTDSRLDVHEDAFGNVTHVMTHGPLEELTIHVEGLIETQDTGGVLRGADERFPPGLFLRSTPLIDKDIDRAGIDRVFGEAVATGGWLIFYTHDVADTPSPWGCTPGLLRHALDAAKRRDMPMVSVAEALRRAGA